MEIALNLVVDAARQRMAAVTAEVAGYVVLLLAQQALDEPRSVRAERVLLSAAGEVHLHDAPAALPQLIEGQLRQLLASLMALAQSSTPALRAASERSPTGDLAQFSGELLAALIPINHAASRRALARLYRETQKSLTRGERAVREVDRVESTPLPALELEARVPTPGPEQTQPSRPACVAQPADTVQTLEQEAPPSARRDGAMMPALPTPTPPPVPAPPSAMAEVVAVEPVSRAEPAKVAEELEIEVDLGELQAPPAGPELEPRRAPESQRSNVSELVARFLSETRDEQHMLEELRRLVGLDVVPRTAPANAESPAASEHAA